MRGSQNNQRVENLTEDGFNDGLDEHFGLKNRPRRTAGRMLPKRCWEPSQFIEAVQERTRSPVQEQHPITRGKREQIPNHNDLRLTRSSAFLGSPRGFLPSEDLAFKH